MELVKIGDSKCLMICEYVYKVLKKFANCNTPTKGLHWLHPLREQFHAEIVFREVPRDAEFKPLSTFEPRRIVRLFFSVWLWVHSVRVDHGSVAS